MTRSWPSWLLFSGEWKGASSRARALFFKHFWREGVGGGVWGGLWQEVERGHQVGNLWQSFWCYPCVCFHKRNPGRHTHTNSVPTHVRAHTHTHCDTKRKLSAPHIKCRSIANLAFGQNFASKLADVKRLWRQGFREGGGEKNALIRMCCSYCVCFWVLWAQSCQKI